MQFRVPGGLQFQHTGQKRLPFILPVIGALYPQGHHIACPGLPWFGSLFRKSFGLRCSRFQCRYFLYKLLFLIFLPLPGQLPCLLAALRPSCAGLVLAACQFFPCNLLGVPRRRNALFDLRQHLLALLLDLLLLLQLQIKPARKITAHTISS